MRRSFYPTLLFALLMVLAACSGPKVANRDSTGANIICFGDSITEGLGLSPEEAFPGRLARWVERPVINLGVSGDTTYDALYRVESDVLSKDPYMVIVEFGGNDFIRKMPKQETAVNMEQIVKKIHLTVDLEKLIENIST